MKLRLCLSGFVCIVVAHAGAKADGIRQPFEVVRELQQMQDHMAEGDAIAQVAHTKAIEHAARVFTGAKPSTWSDTRNARALVVYLFSGGNAAMIGTSIPEGMIGEANRKLYAGALAYGRGDDVKARKDLMPIDAKSLPGAAGAQLALVQATLCAQSDTSKAIALLDLSRLLAPGTLIEEAALRKEMSLIGATGDLGKYTMLARRYLGAYSRSIYVDNFRQLVAATALQIGAADSDEAAQRINKLALSLAKPERRKLYLAIAREAVLSGRIKMATLASEEAVRLSDRASPDETKAMIYFGAAAIVGNRYELGQKSLNAAPIDRLSTTDQALRSSALAVAELIHRPPAAGDVAGSVIEGSVLADAERSLVVSDETLKRATK